MSDYINLKMNQLLTQTESLTDENKKLRDLLNELEQNPLAAEDQNHYFKLMGEYRDKFYESERHCEKLQEQNKILKEALDFYSDDGGRDGEDISNVQKCIMGMIVVVAKGGKRARETLEKVGE